MALNYVTLNLDLYGGGGSLLSSGNVVFTPTVQLTDTTDHQLIPVAPVTASLSATGMVSVKLLATDNANITPSGWGWTVTFIGVAGNPSPQTFFLPYTSGATQYLSSQTPVASAISMLAYMPLPAGTPSAGQVPIATGVSNASKWATPTAWVDAVEAFGADPSFTTDSTTAIQSALTYCINQGGGVVYLRAGVYKVSSTLTCNMNGKAVYILGDGRYVTTINYLGSGDCLRVYDSSTYSGRGGKGGGGVLGVTIDGSNSSASAASTGLHIGDILQLQLDVTTQNWHNFAGSIGVHLDNANFWTEQLYGHIYSLFCNTHVQFNKSGSGAATGSFERCNLDIFIDSNGLGDGVTFTNGAFIGNGRLGIYGNFSTSTTQYAVLRFATANCGIENSVVNIGVELDDTLHIAPYTIYFQPSVFTFLTGCNGNIDFSLASVFTPSNNAGQFLFTGPVKGDNTLYTQPNLGSAIFPQTINSNGQTIFTQWLPFVQIANTGSFTGLILAAGGYSGQQVTVMNGGSGSLTFAASGTSNVADGASDTIASATARTFTWSSTSALWYRSG